MSAQDQTPKASPEKEKPAKKRSFWRRCIKALAITLKCLLLLLLLVLCAAFGGGWWLTQTDGGQQWLVGALNDLLAQPPDSEKPAFKINKLEGSIPANFSFAIQASDKHGLWLNAPKNSFIWNWRELPGSFHIAKIEAADIDISRLPDLPPTPPDPTPSKPLTIKDIQGYINDAAAFLAQKHWWLPAIKLDAADISATLPADILGGATDSQRPVAGLALTANFLDNRLDAGLRTTLSSDNAKPLRLPSFSFENIDINAKLTGAPIPDGLNLSCALNTMVEKPLLEVEGLPADYLGALSQLHVALNTTAHASPDSQKISIALAGPNLDAGHVQLKGNGDWKTNEKWNGGEISGPLNYNLDLEIRPLPEGADSPLAAIRTPATLAIKTSGDLPDLKLALDLACKEIIQNGIKINNTKLSIATPEIAVPLNAVAAALLEKENHIELQLSSVVDNNPGKMSAEVFFQQLPQSASSGWRAGLRNLRLDALGAKGDGNVAALLLTGEKPRLDGNIDIALTSFAEIAKLLPDLRLAGSAKLDVKLVSGLPQDIADIARPLQHNVSPPKSAPQDAHVLLSIPSFSMQSGDSPVEIRNLAGDIKAVDIFSKPGVDAKIRADKISAAGMALSADIGANGSIAGPLKLSVKTDGSVNSAIAAQWEPGQAKIEELNVLADLTPFLNKGSKKKKLAGIRTTSPIQITYGDNGITIANLDLRLLPGGRLRANGGMTPEKLDLALNLDDLDFKQWQQLAPQLPTGSASLAAKLQGSPTKPGGQFKVALNKVKLPKSPTPPVSLALTGDIEHASRGGTLRTKLEIDPATVKALGGDTAQINAALPLLFGPDGVPKPNMEGPLQAKVRWDGALGPIWNLLPIPDRRLNGRIAINIDAGGSLQKPKINGSAAISKARFEDLALGILLTDINLNLELADNGSVRAAKGPLDALPGSMKLALSISDGRGGSVTANGGGALDGSNIDINAKIDRLKPLRRRDVHIELSGNAQVTGSATAPDVKGEIIINQGEVLLNNLEVTSSVTTLDITDETKIKSQSPPPPPPPAQDVGQLHMRVRMLPRFTVEGRGLASIWKADLLIAGALTNPSVTGDISCVRGNFDFLGKIFALTRGVVFFGGGSLANPLVDIDLTHETEDLTAHILVTGPVNKIRVKLTSDPAIPRDEIISRVLFGRSVNDLSRMEMLQLAGAVAQLAGFGGGSGPLGMAKKALGVDVLRLGTADSGSENQSSDDTGGGTTLEMGKYINDYIYMGVQQGFEADSTAFILELELTPRSNLEIRTEQDNTWAGYKWKMNY